MLEWLANLFLEYLPGIFIVGVVVFIALFINLIRLSVPVNPTPDQMIGEYNYYQITAPRMYQSGIKTLEFKEQGKLIIKTDDDKIESGVWDIKIISIIYIAVTGFKEHFT